ncbi:hypothetical protein E2C01_100562 [Portunus trituberculatus]|uniref:Uncharacterized protein n=1 Tax=Portunus trituberculatus TaxID=210409 RepID=A0A5B7K786_PORTR|nr:hypothetical protein [Portunus trituberculatus]
MMGRGFTSALVPVHDVPPSSGVQLLRQGEGKSHACEAENGAPPRHRSVVASLDVIKTPCWRACIILREISICGAVYSLYLRTTVTPLFTNPAPPDACLLLALPLLSAGHSRRPCVSSGQFYTAAIYSGMLLLLVLLLTYVTVPPPFSVQVAPSQAQVSESLLYQNEAYLLVFVRLF